MDSLESLFVQLAVLHLQPDCVYAVSNFHAGQPAVSLGSSSWRKIDLTMSVREDVTTTDEDDDEDYFQEHEHERKRKRKRTRTHIKSWNFDGQHTHHGQLHHERCPKRRRGGDDDGEGGDGEMSIQEWRRHRKRAYEARRRELKLDTQARLDAVLAKQRRQMLRRFAAAAGDCDDPDENSSESDDDDDDGWVYEGQDEDDYTGDGDTHLTREELENRLRRRYCQALSLVDDRLRFSYRVFTECEVFHSGHLLRRGPRHPDRRYSSVRSFLAAEYPDDSVLGFPAAGMTQEALVKRILRAPYVHEATAATAATASNDFSGFVVLLSGRESRFDQHQEYSADTAFLMQRTTPELDKNFAPFSLGLLHRLAQKGHVADAAEREALRNRVSWRPPPMTAEGFENAGPADRRTMRRLARITSSEPLTGTRQSFHGDGVVMTTDQFRFYCLERGLRDIDIAHFIGYRFKHFLDGWVTELLEQRHEAKKDPKSQLLVNQIKMQINSFYGRCAKNTTNFTKSRIVSESYIHNLPPKKRRRAFCPPHATNITLLGAVDKSKSDDGGGGGGRGGKRAKKKRRPPDLLYCVTERRVDAPIFNCVAVAGAILSSSKVVFFDKILTLLRVTDPTRFQLCYFDTDSIMFAMSERNLEDVLKPEHRHRAGEIVGGLMEDKRSEREQSLKLKSEGKFNYAQWRAPKSYVLRAYTRNGRLASSRGAGTGAPGIELQQQHLRLKGIPRKATGDIAADEDALGQDPDRGRNWANFLSMRATGAMEVMMVRESRTTSHCVNLKRRSLVSLKSPKSRPRA